MKQPKWKTVLEMLQRKAFVTNIEVIQQARTTAPHSVIRDLRRKGYNIASRQAAGKHHHEYYLLPDGQEMGV